MLKQSLEVNPKLPVVWNAGAAAPVTVASMLADDALAAAVERALDGADVMTSRHFNDFALAVHAGVVLLRGHGCAPAARNRLD
jgi:hypothetical protein